MDTFLKLEIITPEISVYTGNVKSIKVPGKQSPFEVLINHAPIVSSLLPGIIKFTDEKNIEHKYQNGNGFIEVNKNIVAIFVDSAIKI